MKPTVKDVARAAGVSIGTVSRVLAKNNTVSGTINARVQAAIDELGYQPYSLGRNLRLNRSEFIGLIIPDITNPFFAELAKQLEVIASKAGYSVLVANTHDDPGSEQAQLQSLLQRTPAGIVITPVENSAAGSAMPANLVCVAVDRLLEGYPLISGDNFAGGRLAAEHLLDLGHRKLGYLSGPVTIEVSRKRLEGFRAAVEDAIQKGNQVSLTLMAGSFDYRSGEEAGRRMLSDSSRPTAIATANDQQAIGLLRASRDMGLRVPDDLSIVGFDDIPLASLVLPRLTTVCQPIQEMAETVIAAVLRRARIETSISLPPLLIDRESTAAPQVY